MEFSPSLMCIDYLDMKSQLEALDPLVDRFHIDFMDGHFTKNIALSPDLVKAMRSVTTKPFDAHFMAEDPHDWLDLFAELGCEYLSPHAEVINTDAFRVIDHIRAIGAKPGIVLNPATSIDAIRYYMGRLDMITVMTVDVGYAGQKFIPEMLEKIRELRRLKEENHYQYIIQVDGSCNAKTFKRLEEAGAESLVVGTSGLFNLDPDMNLAWQKMQENYSNATGKER
ncbi:MAG: D-allulose 6-phosphate 3-epimerase [Peptoniphilaceae bacterium]|nr:D-allulose 6-phosphate 3-epimerase [Peptoniphilaceae bacterium]MDY6086219.1 D-allulose 6-phosphate 3-epimerase [Peptoniphilaceae bacterium]